MLFRLASRMLATQQPQLAAADGARLTRIGEDAWVADRNLLYGARGRQPLPLRMVVLRDPAGNLTLYSPLGLDPGTTEALDGLGTVRRLIVPNRFHTLFVGTVAGSYPQAELLFPTWDAGLRARFGDRSSTVRAVASVAPGLEVRAVRLRDGLDELVLYHDASELLAVGDLLFNLQVNPQQLSPASRLIHRLNGIGQRPALSRLQRLLLLKDRAELGGFYRWALGKPFSQISMAHGQLIASDAREHFYQLFSPYGRG